jgi:hypothetical protein
MTNQAKEDAETLKEFWLWYRNNAPEDDNVAREWLREQHLELGGAEIDQLIAECRERWDLYKRLHAVLNDLSGVVDDDSSRVLSIEEAREMRRLLQAAWVVYASSSSPPPA